MFFGADPLAASITLAIVISHDPTVNGCRSPSWPAYARPFARRMRR
jgi:hypothetical protein